VYINTPLRKIPLNPPFTNGDDLAPSFGKGGQGRILSEISSEKPW
jgi:hypothetical protein